MKEIALTVTVTQEHIDAGETECSKCPIALALQDALIESALGICQVHVRMDIIKVYHPEFGVFATKVVPIRMVKFIDAFDHCNQVQPFRSGIRLVFTQ